MLTKKSVCIKILFLIILLLLGFFIEFCIKKLHHKSIRNAIREDDTIFKILYLGDSIASMNYPFLIRELQKNVSSSNLPFSKFVVVPFFKQNYKVSDFNTSIDSIIKTIRPHLVFSMIGSIDLRKKGELYTFDLPLFKQINQTHVIDNHKLINNINHSNLFITFCSQKKFNPALNIIVELLEKAPSIQEIQVALSLSLVYLYSGHPIDNTTFPKISQISKLLKKNARSKNALLNSLASSSLFHTKHIKLRDEINNLWKTYYIVNDIILYNKIFNNKKVDEKLVLKKINKSIWSRINASKITRATNFHKKNSKKCVNFCGPKFENFAVKLYIKHFRQNLLVIKIASALFNNYNKNQLKKFHENLKKNPFFFKLKIPSPVLLSILVSIYEEKQSLVEINQMKAYEIDYLAGLNIMYSMKMLYELSNNKKEVLTTLKSNNTLDEILFHYPRLKVYFNLNKNSKHNSHIYTSNKPINNSIVIPYHEIKNKLYQNHSYLITIRYPGSSDKSFSQLKDSPYYIYLDSHQLNKYIKVHGRDHVIKDIVTSEIGHLTNQGNTMLAELMVETILKFNITDYEFMKYQPENNKVNTSTLNNEI